MSLTTEQREKIDELIFDYLDQDLVDDVASELFGVEYGSLDGEQAKIADEGLDYAIDKLKEAEA